MFKRAENRVHAIKDGPSPTPSTRAAQRNDFLSNRGAASDARRRHSGTDNRNGVTAEDDASGVVQLRGIAAGATGGRYLPCASHRLRCTCQIPLFRAHSASAVRLDDAFAAYQVA